MFCCCLILCFLVSFVCVVRLCWLFLVISCCLIQHRTIKVVLLIHIPHIIYQLCQFHFMLPFQLKCGVVMESNSNEFESWLRHLVMSLNLGSSPLSKGCSNHLCLHSHCVGLHRLLVECYYCLKISCSENSVKHASDC